MKKGLVLTLILAALVGVGCSKKKNSVAATTKKTVPVVDIPDGPFSPDGSGPGQGPGDDDGLTFEAGGTGSLVIDGSTEGQKNMLLSEYTGRSMNDPKNIRVNLNFRKTGTKTWGGTVTTTYVENGNIYYWYFDSGSSKEVTQYNVWFKDGGKPVFHAVLEDYYFGAVVVTIDEYTDLGDGAGAEDEVSGSIWFKNYGLTYAPHPPTNCWFVVFRKGDTPYDCRPWPSGDLNNTYLDVDPTKQSSDPFKGYKRLGRFHGVSIKDAFDGGVNLESIK